MALHFADAAGGICHWDKLDMPNGKKLLLALSLSNHSHFEQLLVIRGKGESKSHHDHHRQQDIPRKRCPVA